MQWSCCLRRLLSGAVFVSACFGLTATANSAPVWTRQIGTAQDDAALSVATDSEGNVYVAGSTAGSLSGDNRGGSDAWLAKFDADGNRQWLRQPGTSEADVANGIATDNAENVYAVGTTAGVLFGNQDKDEDAWIAKYDPTGTRLWARQFGTVTTDSASGVATDSARGVYIVGDTSGPLAGKFLGGYDDAWVAKYDADGKRLWARQIGTESGDWANGVATDSARNVYVTGTTEGPLGGAYQGKSDAWVAKYNTNGTRQWVRHLGDTYVNHGNAVATDSQRSVYVVGETEICCGPIFFERSYPWITKFDTAGHLKWTQNLDLAWRFSGAYSVAIDAENNIYLAGYTYRIDPPYGSDTETDAWVAKYDASGSQVWLKRVGVPKSVDSAASVATDTWGNILLAGSTGGAFAGPYHGGTDAFVVKYPADQ